MKWQGFGSALKPSHEPIVVARKPLIGTLVENVMAHGCGGINIDGCRVPGEPVRIDNYKSNGVSGCISHTGGVGHSGREYSERIETSGRWPANLIHDGSYEVVSAFPVSSSTTGVRSARSQEYALLNLGAPLPGSGKKGGPKQNEYADCGSPARFFYVAKTSKAERAGSKHPTVKPIALMRYLCRLVTPPGGLILDPFAGSGTTLEAALLEGFQAIGCEMTPEYYPDIDARLRRAQPMDDVA